MHSIAVRVALSTMLADVSSYRRRMNVPSNFSRDSAASLGNVIMDAAPLVGSVPHQLPTSYSCPRRRRQHSPSWPTGQTRRRKHGNMLRLCSAISRLRYRPDTPGLGVAGTAKRQSFHQQHVDGDVELLLWRADDDAVDRRNVGKVA